jgi:hypothetical protein
MSWAMDEKSSLVSLIRVVSFDCWFFQLLVVAPCAKPVRL